MAQSQLQKKVFMGCKFHMQLWKLHTDGHMTLMQNYYFNDLVDLAGRAKKWNKFALENICKLLTIDYR